MTKKHAKIVYADSASLPGEENMTKLQKDIIHSAILPAGEKECEMLREAAIDPDFTIEISPGVAAFMKERGLTEEDIIRLLSEAVPLPPEQ